jgi:hypothetical protein
MESQMAAEGRKHCNGNVNFKALNTDEADLNGKTARIQ